MATHAQLHVSVEELRIIRLALAQRADRLNAMADRLLAERSSDYTQSENALLVQGADRNRSHARDVANLLSTVHAALVVAGEAP